jgi:hypothetical protein
LVYKLLFKKRGKFTLASDRTEKKQKSSVRNVFPWHPPYLRAAQKKACVLSCLVLYCNFLLATGGVSLGSAQMNRMGGSSAPRMHQAREYLELSGDSVAVLATVVLRCTGRDKKTTFNRAKKDKEIYNHEFKLMRLGGKLQRV